MISKKHVDGAIRATCSFIIDVDKAWQQVIGLPLQYIIRRLWWEPIFYIVIYLGLLGQDLPEFRGFYDFKKYISLVGVFS